MSDSSLRTVLPVQVSAISEIRDNSCELSSSGPCLDFVSSDETIDRYSEVISASGWKLDSYLRNPVFQNAHQYGDIIFTLGRALVTEVRARKLFQRVQFATEANPMARVAHALYKGKFLSAVSVGFIPITWEDGTEETSFRRKYLTQELLEVSAVAIPANPNALALGLKSGAIDKSDLRDLFDLLRLTLDPWSAAAERSADAASASDPSLTLLLHLHQIMKKI
jgi:HK97 family phage prohead protease